MQAGSKSLPKAYRHPPTSRCHWHTPTASAGRIVRLHQYQRPPSIRFVVSAMDFPTLDLLPTQTTHYIKPHCSRHLSIFLRTNCTPLSLPEVGCPMDRSVNLIVKPPCNGDFSVPAPYRRDPFLAHEWSFRSLRHTIRTGVTVNICRFHTKEDPTGSGFDSPVRNHLLLFLLLTSLLHIADAVASIACLSSILLGGSDGK